MNNESSMIWEGPPVPQIPDNIHHPAEIIKYAASLSDKQKKQIIIAFNNESYEMGAEYVWRLSMIKLRSAIKNIGMKLIGEILGNDQIDEYNNIEAVLTDFNTIELARSLGVINSAGLLILKHSFEIITHYFSEKAINDGESLELSDGVNIIKSCAQYILSESNLAVADGFIKLRNRLLSENLPISDPQLDQLFNSPLVYLNAVLSVLLTTIKNFQGAELGCSLNNLSLIFNQLWRQVGEREKYSIGITYRNVTSAGNMKAATVLKNCLMGVRGFDYVPEDFRSITIRKAARALVEAHFGVNSYYTEPIYISNLIKHGSSIPDPAFADCIQAYVCIYTGNYYDYSFDAAPVAEKELIKISKDKWIYFFRDLIQNDDKVLSKLFDDRPRKRFTSFIKMYLGDYGIEENLDQINKELYINLLNDNSDSVIHIAKELFKKIKGD